MEGLSPIRFGSLSFTTNSLGPNDPKVGDEVASGNDQYRFVYNAGNSAIVPSRGVTLSAVSGYSVTVSTTTSVDLPVGICKHATISTGYYGYVLTKGFVVVKMGANASAAAGQLLVPADDGAFALKASGIGNTSPAVLKTMEAIASGASGMAFVSLL